MVGFGLDLSTCASTGRNDDLIYVSPKSGRAVSASAGEPYRDRLLPLPGFLIDGNTATTEDLVAGLQLTGFFIERHIFTAARTHDARRARTACALHRRRSRRTQLTITFMSYCWDYCARTLARRVYDV